MILDEVLQEENRSFDRDDMVDIFTEGFLYALEMQEAGFKAGSTEELSEKLAEGANIAISENMDAFAKRAQDHFASAKRHREQARKYAGNDETRYKYHKGAEGMNNRIGNRIADRLRNKAVKGTYFPERKSD